MTPVEAAATSTSATSGQSDIVLRREDHGHPSRRSLLRRHHEAASNRTGHCASPPVALPGADHGRPNSTGMADRGLGVRGLHGRVQYQLEVGGMARVGCS